MKDLVSALCAVALLAVMLEMLLPEGSFQKYVRMVSGLLVMGLLLQAAAHHGKDMEWNFETTPGAWSADAAQKEQEAKLMVEYRRRLEEDIKIRYGVQAYVEIGEDMNIRSILLEGSTQAVRRKIAEEYALPEGQVTEK